jgi:hypothetical protein
MRSPEETGANAPFVAIVGGERFTQTITIKIL